MSADCCGCFRRRKKQGRGKEDSEEHEPTPSKASRKPSISPHSSAKSIPKRGSLQSLKSTTSVYYDCQDVLDGPSQSLQSSGSGLKDRGSQQAVRDSGDANGLATSSLEGSRAIRKLLAGSLRVGEHKGIVDGIGQYEQADPTGFMVRGKDYMQSKRKVKAQGEVYRLIGCDVYQFDQKINHIAQYIDLPKPPRLSQGHRELPSDKRLPPLLIINIQLPLYKAAMIPGRGSTDGKGVHIVQYYGLPEDFELADLGNEAAVGLLQRLVHDGKEANGDKTRSRLKLIARVVNVEEWAEKGPLSGYEHGLLRNYNDKPILTRPQHHFFLEKNYLEIDLDVHSYAWTARKALSGFLPRLGTVVFEDALIVQGNSEQELPEVVMACARCSHLDFDQAQPFPGELHSTKHSSPTVHLDQPLHANTFPDDNMSADAHSEDSKQSQS